MHARRFILAFVLGSIVGVPASITVAVADTLIIEAVKQAADIPRPVRGQSMAAVEAAYGQPNQVKGPVGQPPITAWVYPGFTVYFEAQTVLHSVVNR